MNDDAPIDLYQEVISSIQNAFAEARDMNVTYYNSASFATVDAKGNPTVRTITICDVNEDGLLFFINKESGKAAHLEYNPNVALCFFWETLNQQLIVQGTVNELDRDEAEKHWSKRERKFQLSAWLSTQKAHMGSSKELEEKRQSIKQTFCDQRIPMPENWAAYRIFPNSVELWRANWEKVSEHTCYICEQGQWSKKILLP